MFQNFFKYKVVAYNNRTYKGYRFVDNELRTYWGSLYWIGNRGDMSKYLYDIYDTINNKMVFDYSELFYDYDKVKSLILKTDSNYSRVLLNYIFAFKRKWEKKIGISISIYFGDLMTIYQLQMEKFGKNMDLEEDY